MKTYKFNVISLVLLAVALLSSCKNDDVIYDIAPVQYEITLIDEDGNNLLDENLPDNLIGADIYVIFNGDRYDTNWEPPYTVQASRYLMPTWYGLQVWQYYKWENNGCFAIPGQYSLQFGDFFGDEEQHLSIELVIPCRGVSYTIELIHKFKWKHNKPNSSTYLIYNGEEINGWRIEIVVPNSAE